MSNPPRRVILQSFGQSEITKWALPINAGGISVD